MYSVIKINCFSNGYWYYPSIFTFSKRGWASKPFKTLDDLFVALELKNKPYKISSNGGECTIDVFNYAQRKNEFSFLLDKKQKIDKDFLFEEIINNKLKIAWNYKSIKKIFAGCIPLVSKQQLLSEFQSDDPVTIYWTGNTFNWLLKK